MSQKQQGNRGRKRSRIVRSRDFWSTAFLVPAGIVLLATTLVFANSIGNGFVNWDDPVNLLENPYLDAFTTENILNIFHPEKGLIIGNYNPLPIFTFAIEKALFGLNPTVFHLDNLLLHLLCVFLVYRLFLKLKLGIWGAAFGAILFGLHPMRVESVAWITERKDVLFGAFYLAGLVTYIRYLQRRNQRTLWYLITLGTFVLALFSKIQAVAFPLSMLVIDYALKRPLKWKLIWEKIPYFGLSLIFGLAGIYFLGSEGSLDDTTNYTFTERLMVGSMTYLVYLVKSVVPYQLSPLYPYPPELPLVAWFSPIGLLAVAGLFIWAWRKGYRGIVTGLALFTVNVIFVLQVLAAGQGYLADRFTYIPYAGLFFLYGGLFENLLDRDASRRPVVLGMAGLIVVIFGLMTVRQNRIWKNGETLWTHVAEHFPRADTPWQNLGKYKMEQGRKSEAIADFSKAVEHARDKDIPLNSRGKAYFDLGQQQKALTDFNRAIEGGTEIGEIYINRGSLYGARGEYDQSLRDLNKGLELDPDYLQGYKMRSLLYMNTQRYREGLADLERILQDEPQNPDILYESGLALNRLGRHQEALERLEQAIRINPNVPQFYRERAAAYQALGMPEKARQDLQRGN